MTVLLSLLIHINDSTIIIVIHINDSSVIIVYSLTAVQ